MLEARYLHLQEHIGKAAVLIEALPYLQKFRGKEFVIKVGGAAMEDPELVDSLLRDVVFLEAAGINPVLVHGGGKAISRAMAEVGLQAKFVHGQRVTDKAAISLVARTLGAKINPALVHGIENFGGRAVGVPGTEVFVGRKSPPLKCDDGAEVDLGYVGKVVDFRLKEIRKALKRELVPVLTPLAAEKKSGDPLNVNADIAAAALAGKMRVEKLIFMSDVLGVMRDPERSDTLIPSLSRSEAEALIEQGIISGGMIPKVRSGLDALGRGVEKVHLIDGRIPHSLLLEIFTDVGIGTQIVMSRSE